MKGKGKGLFGGTKSPKKGGLILGPVKSPKQR